MPSDDPELRRAVREAEEAEERLRRMKESLIPRDRADALEELLQAEMAAMMAASTRRFLDDLRAANSEDEARAVLERLRQAMLDGTARVEATILQQMQAWTLASLEDRAAEDAPE